MRPRILCALAAAAASLLAALPAQAQRPPATGGGCNASIYHTAAPPLVQYDPFDGGAAYDDMIIHLLNRGSTACTIGLAVASQMPGNTRQMHSGAKNLDYRVETPAGVEYPNNVTAIIGSYLLPAGPGQEVLVPVRVKVTAGIIAAASRYSDRVVIRGYDLSTGGALTGDIDQLVEATIESRAQINIAGVAGPFASLPFSLQQIDFGTLETNEVRNAFVQVRATGPVLLTVESQNRGALRHVQLQQQAGPIGYDATLDGQLLSLGSGSTTLNRSPPVTLDGINYLLNFKITGLVDALPAGEYKDMLTFTIVPQ